MFVFYLRRQLYMKFQGRMISVFIAKLGRRNMSVMVWKSASQRTKSHSVEVSALRLSRIIGMLLLSCIVLFSPLGCWSKELKPLDNDYWAEFYQGGQVYGSFHYNISRQTLNHHPVYKYERTLSQRFFSNGSETTYKQDDIVYISSAFMPIMSLTRTAEQITPSTTREVKYQVNYHSKDADITVTNDGQVLKRTVTIPADANISTYYAYLIGHKRLSVGESFKSSTLDTSYYTPWLEFRPFECRCVGKTTIRMNGKSYDCLQIVEKGSEYKEDETISYVLEDRTIVIRKYPGLNRVQILTPGIKVFRDTLHSNPDITQPILAIDASESLDSPHSISHLKARLTEIHDDRYVKSDLRQSASFSQNKNYIEFTTTAKPFDILKSIQIPITCHPCDQWINPSQGIQSNDKDIRALSHSIVGDETDAYKAMSKIRDWVSSNIKWENPSSVPVSATDVLKAGTGNCMHHTVLCVALARSLGIPSRPVCGIYCPGGMFFYAHAWVECYVGEWAYFEPSWSGMYPDATYIKLKDDDLYLDGLDRSSVQIVEYK